MDVRVAQPTDAGRPGISPIHAPAHPIHLDARPDGAVVLRVHHERGHPGDDHRRAFCGQFYGQLCPPLAAVRERNTADGWVPAKRVSGSAGAMAKAQVCMAFIGESSRSQRAPRSSLRYTPESVPAYTMCGARGCTASALTSFSG